MQETKCGLVRVRTRSSDGSPGPTSVHPDRRHADALREDIELLASQSYPTPLNVLATFIYDVKSGEIRWERPEERAERSAG